MSWTEHLRCPNCRYGGEDDVLGNRVSKDRMNASCGECGDPLMTDGVKLHKYY